jgi:pyruvate formate lyase activating enzyme
MNIKGFQGTSLLDYPGRLASLIFFGGCNLTCPFCHNPALVLEPDAYPDYPPEALLDELRERRKFIDGVVVSGGEPTLERYLAVLLREVKALGLSVKLDTNGLAPAVLEKLLAEGLVDYLALDLKTAPARYRELHPGPVNIADLCRSAALVAKSGVDYEFRTTCVPGFVEEGDIREIGALIRGGKRWVLQQFVPRHALDESLHEIEPHSPELIRAFAELANGYVSEVGVRGI